ncbi:MAG: hypothetical protein MJZ01_08110 [Bacteroidales bacterium]|nr:hypothetical protein [Bacteroidales bacterium]
MSRKRKITTMETKDDVLCLFEQVEKTDGVYEKYMMLLKARYDLLTKSAIEAGDYESALEYKQKFIIEEAAALEKFGTKERLSVQEVVEVLLMIIKKHGVGLHNNDMAKIARFIGFITRYSPESVRKYLRNRTPVPNSERILTVNSLLNTLGFKELVNTK